MINNGMSWLSLGNYINPKARNTELSNDYNQLTNRPIITLTGTSQNPIKLWKLDVGLYILNGYVQHTDALLSEARGLFVSATVGIVNGKYVISAFIPFWEGQYEYILPSLSSETYTEHQMIRMITQGNSLTLDNIREYFPTQDYHPTTKKYVDETMDAIRNELGKMGLNNNDIQSLMKENRRRDIAIQALLSQNSDKMVTIDEEVHNISMDYSLDEGIATINTLEGDTLVNVSKDTEYDKVLSYEQDIVENTNTVDLEVDGNINPIIVGDTLVNVCTQNNPTAITNKYTVEGNNHFALQDEVEGNCRPIIQGNTIVNRSKTKDITPLTTYVSEVEGNEMSLVDDTDTHVRVDKLVGDTMVNLWKEENVITSYRATLENHRIKCTTDKNKYHNFFINDISIIKPSTTYTCIVNIYKNTLNEKIFIFSSNAVNNEYDIYSQNNNSGWYIEGGKVGQFKLAFTTPTEITATRLFRSFVTNENQIEGQEVELNIVLLEGDYTNKPIPQEYFEGLKNSYEDGYIPSDVWCNYNKGEASTSNVMSTITSEHSFEYKAQSSYSGNISPANMLEILNLKTEMTYTFIGKVNAQCTIDIIYNDNISMNKSIIFQPNIPTTFLFKTPQSYNRICIRLISTDTSVRSITFSDIILLEGDYTSNPPTYEEVMEHGGKYRCEVEVQGKNLLDIKKPIHSPNTKDIIIDGESITFTATNSYASVYYDIPVKIGKTYTFSYKSESNSTCNILIYNDKVASHIVDKMITQMGGVSSKSFIANTETVCIRFSTETLSSGSYTWVKPQLEEGNTVTAYEPYYNQTQTVYLNSPLLKGDEVVYKGGKLCHYHKMGKVVLDGSEKWHGNSSQPNENLHNRYILKEDAKAPDGKIFSDNFKRVNSMENEGIKIGNYAPTIYVAIDKTKLSEFNANGFKQWFSENPTTVVYELANPYYETISTSELLLPITTNCKLLTSSNIPLTTMSTRVFTEEVNILANTQYSLNFNSDVASTVNITLGGTVLSNQAIVKGYNKLSITTPSTLVDSLLIIEGSGVNISEVVVTEYDEGVCEYIEGLKSSFEDGWIPENKILEISEGVHNTTNTSYFYDATIPSELVNKTCTLIVKRPKESPIIEVYSTYWGGGYFSLRDSELITRVIKLTDSKFRYTVIGTQGNTFRADADACELFLFEGDWTHLTEEDLNHLGQYKVEYKVVGKNKFDINKTYQIYLTNNTISGNARTWALSILTGQNGTNSSRTVDKLLYLKKGYYIINCVVNKFIPLDSENFSFAFSIRNYDKDGNYISHHKAELNSIVELTCDGYYDIQIGNRGEFSISNIQLEEGTVATEYEPYKESIQTVYLNSPLLEGDTIEEIDGEVYHVHRRYISIFGSDSYWSKVNDLGDVIRFQKGVTYPTANTKIIANQFGKYHMGYNENWEHYYVWDNQLYIFVKKDKLISYNIYGLRQWLSNNPLIVVYELANPTYELIPSSSIVCKSYPNGHLDFNTNVHINNTVNFVKANLPITYANTSTNYKLQFVSDKDMENVTINALGNIMENVTITKGLNKISFTSPSDATNILTFEGIGYAYISNVQLVATDKDIDYFKGLYSTYECGLIEDESNENYGKYEVNIVSYNAPIQFGKGGKIE